MHEKTFSLVCSLAVLATLGGCGGEQTVALYPVSGQVSYQGKPAANALVVFHDKRPREQLRDVPIPRATTDVEGKFKLSSYASGDGAPAGEYRVTVMLPGAKLPGQPRGEATSDSSSTDPAEGIEDPIDPESVEPPEDVLKGKYIDPETSGLEATVLEQENSLDPFELQ